MEEKQKKREITFWVIFIILVLAILEIASYLSTDSFILCGRYGGCDEIGKTKFLSVIFFLVGITILFRSKSIGKFLFRIQWRTDAYRKSTLGPKVYRWSMAFAGLVLIGMACSLIFGPVTI